MTREEITKRIEEIEHAEFMLQMKDYWDWKDRNRYFKYESEMSRLVRQLKETEV